MTSAPTRLRGRRRPSLGSFRLCHRLLSALPSSPAKVIAPRLSHCRIVSIEIIEPGMDTSERVRRVRPKRPRI